MSVSRVYARRVGFTLVELMIVVSVIGLLAVLAIPSFVRARETSQLQTCKNNLRQIEGAKDQWALEYGKTLGDAVVAADIDPYLKRGFAGIEEPLAGSYVIGAVGADTTCSKFDVAMHPSTI